jgi:AraC-like DNA-binding protein
MDEFINIPEATLAQPQLKAGDISFVNYSDKGGPFKNRVIFNCFAFSFVQNGQKHIYRSSENTVLKAGSAMLIPEGNSIIAEHSLDSNPYSSFLIFFPGHMARDFLAAHVPHRKTNQPAQQRAPYIHFELNNYLQEYVRGMQLLVQNRSSLSVAVARHKLEELLLVIYELFPVELLSMFVNNTRELSLKTIVENNLLNKLNLDELSFLANRSLSSFKRDFERAYGIPPQKYMRERRLEIACTELAKGKQPGELYLASGYESLANFCTAFKKKYSLSPGAYRQQNSH